MRALGAIALRSACLAATALLSTAGFALDLRLSRELRSAPGAPPATAPRRADFARPTQALIVALKVNAEARGDRLVRMTEAGEFLLRGEDLRELAGIEAPSHNIEGDEFVELRAIAGARVAFDDKTLTLELTLPPQRLPAQHFDLTAAPKPADFHAPARSALFNYRLGYAGTDVGSSGTLSLAGEAAVAAGDWLLRNQSYHSRSSETSSNIRLETQLIRDDRGSLRRLVLGDSVTPGLVLGSGVPFAGITLAKAWQLEPYLNRHPGAGFRGIAEFPSQVDFYVGNSLVLRQNVAPGPFDIRNFSYYGGRRDVRVVVRDVFGREQTVAYPFYFSDQGLAAGLHDYSYQAGWLRGQLGVESNNYGRFAFSAFHQYGFTDSWTLGLRTEGTARRVNGGPDVFYRNEALGLFALHAAASRDRDSGRDGHAVSISHAFLRGEFSSQLVWQRFSPHYVILADGATPRLPERDFSASLGYSSAGFGSLNVGFTRLELPAESPARSVSLTYSRPLAPRMNLVTLLRRQLSEPRGHEVFVGMQYVPRPDQNVNLSARRDLQGVKTATLSWANQVPRGEGAAYSVNVQRQQTPEGVNLILAPRLDLYTRYGTLSGEVTRFDGAATRTTGYSLALSGALVAAGGHLLASRPIADAFAIVELVPPLAGVRVYENRQEVGRTDARGRILLPNIASYSSNYASLASTDIPIEYTIERIGRNFSPSLRSGMVVPFNVARLRSFSGRFVYRLTGASRPLEYHLVMLTTQAGTFEIPTGKEGEFYAESLPAGAHRARVEILGIRCEFALEVPSTDESFVSLGEVPTCDVTR